VKTLQLISLLATTVTTGLMAGLFYSFSTATMPGLAATDDRTFVHAMERICVAILNGWFALCFAGAAVLGVATVLLHLSGDGRQVLPWIIAGVALYIVQLVITMAFNVPLNNQLEAAAADISKVTDPAAVRAAFEDAWNRWNVIRTWVNIASFAVLAWALVEHGRLVA
jgi:uncharacterized membrane protein